ncbi:MAG: hypothetical protein ACRELB_19980, partial [Polyangiaceae bacterium]
MRHTAVVLAMGATLSLLGAVASSCGGSPFESGSGSGLDAATPGEDGGGDRTVPLEAGDSPDDSADSTQDGRSGSDGAGQEGASEASLGEAGAGDTGPNEGSIAEGGSL